MSRLDTASIFQVSRQSVDETRYSGETAQADSLSSRFERDTGDRATFVGDPSLANAEFSREAGRAATRSSITSELGRMLLERHKALARRAALSSLSRDEQLELALVRWKLDQIADAMTVESLDAMERFVHSVEQFGKQVHSISEQMTSAAEQAGERGGRR